MNIKVFEDIPEITRESVIFANEENLKEVLNIMRNYWNITGYIYKYFYNNENNIIYVIRFRITSSEVSLMMYTSKDFNVPVWQITYNLGTSSFTDISVSGFLPPAVAVDHIDFEKGGSFTNDDVDRFNNYLSLLNLRISDSILYIWAYKCIDKLKKINTKLDYMLQLPSTRVDGSISFATNITGITTTSGSTMSAYLVGNYLFLFHNMTLSSAAQSSVGTGNFTAKLVGTYTITNFVASSPSIDNTDNLKKISSTTPVGANYEIASSTGYTTGNGQPAAFFWRTSISGTSLKIQLYVKAVKTATSNWQLSVLIPVLRVPPYTG